MINVVAIVFLLSQIVSLAMTACFFITSTDAGCDDEICIESWRSGVCMGMIKKVVIIKYFINKLEHIIL